MHIQIQKLVYNSWFESEVVAMKHHKFWAWCAAFCMLMVYITGVKRK